MRVIKEKFLCHPAYDFDANCSSIVRHKYQFPTEIYSENTFYKVVTLENENVLASANTKSIDGKNYLQVSVDSDKLSESTDIELVNLIAFRLGAHLNPDNFYDMATHDPFLATLVTKYKGLHIPQSISVYESLINCIIGQQISVHVANILKEFFVKTYGNEHKSNGIKLYRFPSAKELSNINVSELQRNKFSLRKAEYIIEISKLEATGKISLKKLRSEHHNRIREELLSLRGVGEWTVNWLLMGTFGYEDAFPFGDLALQKAITKIPYGPNDISSINALDYSMRWRPYRSWATAYIFEAIRDGYL